MSREQLLEMGVLDEEEVKVLDNMVENAHPRVVHAFEQTLEDLNSYALALRLVAIAKENTKSSARGIRPRAPTPNDGIAMQLLDELQEHGHIDDETVHQAHSLLTEENDDMLQLMEEIERDQHRTSHSALRIKFLSGLRSIVNQRYQSNGKGKSDKRMESFQLSFVSAASALYREGYISEQQFRIVKDKIRSQGEYPKELYEEYRQEGDENAIFNAVLSLIAKHQQNTTQYNGEGNELNIQHNDLVEKMRCEGTISGSDSTILRHLWADGDPMVKAAWQEFSKSHDIQMLQSNLLALLEREKMQLVESHEHAIHVVEGLRALECLTDEEADILKRLVEYDRESQLSPESSPYEQASPRPRGYSATSEQSAGVHTRAANVVAAAIEQYYSDRDVDKLVDSLKSAAVSDFSDKQFRRQVSLSSLGPDVNAGEEDFGACEPQEFAEKEVHPETKIIDSESQSKLLELVSELFHHGLCSSAEASALSRLVNAQDERLLAILEAHRRLVISDSVEHLDELAHSLRTLGDLIEEHPENYVRDFAEKGAPETGHENSREVSAVRSKIQYLLHVFLSRNSKAKQYFTDEESDMLMDLGRRKHPGLSAAVEVYEVDQDEDNLLDSLKRLARLCQRNE